MIACTLLQPRSYLFCDKSVSRGLKLVPSVLFRDETCPKLLLYIDLVPESSFTKSPSQPDWPACPSDFNRRLAGVPVCTAKRGPMHSTTTTPHVCVLGPAIPLFYCSLCRGSPCHVCITSFYLTIIIFYHYIYLSNEPLPPSLCYHAHSLNLTSTARLLAF